MRNRAASRSLEAELAVECVRDQLVMHAEVFKDLLEQARIATIVKFIDVDEVQVNVLRA